MELCVLWTLANIFVFSVPQVYGNLPIPVLHFEKNIIEDEDTSITCTLPYNDYPDVKLVIKGNTTIRDCIPKRGNYPNVTCTVEVTRELHEMEFTCEAEFKTLSLPKKMNIQTEPVFTYCPDNVVWIEGQENSFHCSAKGYPPPTVTCDRKNNSYKVEEKFTAMRDMMGVYTCIAKNFDMVKKTVNVSVEHKPKVSSIKVSPPLHGEGDKVEITCKADGVPHPSYSWNTPSSDLQFSADNQTVTIKSLQKNHLGNYQCIVENKHGTNNGNQTLNLAVKPKISRFDIEPSIELLEGTNVTLTCEASGSPPPVLSWSKPGSDVQMSQDKRTIKIWGLTKRHVGSYTCTCQNEHGSDTQSRQLSLAESKGNRGERQEPVTATILATLISTCLFYYLY